MLTRLYKHFGLTELHQYLPLDLNSNDESGNSNNGTDTSITYGGQYGKIGAGALFNGSSSKIDFTASATLKMAGQMAVMCWIKGSAAGVPGQCYAGGASPGGWRLTMSGSAAGMLIQTNGGAGATADGKTNIIDGRWHFILGQWTGARVEIYCDGALEGIASQATGPTYPATVYATIGRYSDTGGAAGWWNGSIDEWAVYNTSFSQKDIRAYMNKVRAIHV